MTDTKVTFGFWTILKILLFSTIFLFHSCLDLEADLTVNGELYDLNLDYSVTAIAQNSGFYVGDRLPFYLPLTQNDWLIWQNTLGLQPDGAFQLQEETGQITAQIRLRAVDGEALQELLPIQLNRGDNSLEVTLFALEEWFDLTGQYPLNEEDLFRLSIRPPSLLTTFVGAEYDEGENQLFLQTSAVDFLEKREDWQILMEW